MFEAIVAGLLLVLQRPAIGYLMLGAFLGYLAELVAVAYLAFSSFIGVIHGTNFQFRF